MIKTQKSNLVACDGNGRSPIKATLSFRSTVNIVASPRVTLALKAAATRARNMHRTLSWKMQRATECLTNSLQAGNGRKTIEAVAAERFNGDETKAVPHLVGMLQHQVRERNVLCVAAPTPVFTGCCYSFEL